MTGERIPSQANPIGEKYAKLATTFLELHTGQLVDSETIEYLGNLMGRTECELAGTSEVANTLGVSRQRVYQIKEELPPLAGVVRATPLWLVEDIRQFKKDRKRD